MRTIIRGNGKVHISGPKKTRIDPITAKTPKPGEMGKLLVEGCAGLRNTKPPLMERIKNIFILPKEEKPKEVSMLHYMLGREEVSMAQHLIENGAIIMDKPYNWDTHDRELKTCEIPDLHRDTRLMVGSKKADEEIGFMLIDGGDNLEANLRCTSLYRVSEDKVSPTLVGVLNFYKGKISSFYESAPYSVNFVIELTKDGKTADMLRKAPFGYSFRKNKIIGKVEAVEKALEAGDMEKVRELLKAEKPKPRPKEHYYSIIHGIGIMGPNDREA